MARLLVSASVLVTLVRSNSVHRAAPPNTIEIATGVYMPLISLGTCIESSGSDPALGLAPWLDAGGIGIDTAKGYGDQKVIGQILSERSARKSVFITTKIPPRSGASASDCVSLLQNDLRQLNTSYVDLLLIHRPVDDATNAACWKGLEQAHAQGLTRAIGISNFHPDQVATLLKTANIKPAVNQGAFHDELVSYSKQVGITYEPVEVMKICKIMNAATLDRIAAAHSVSTVQVCLRFFLDRGLTLAVGTGGNASKVGVYAKENLAVYKFRLTQSEVEQLDPGLRSDINQLMS